LSIDDKGKREEEEDMDGCRQVDHLERMFRTEVNIANDNRKDILINNTIDDSAKTDSES
jgi:hypothetical protein